MSKNPDILIVEENLAESAHLKHILEQHDFGVVVEHNGKIALDAARARPPQIVISAVLLPEMNGYELCRRIKADEYLKHIPVILLTALSDATDIFRGMECGADNFITKPYDEELLISRIRFILLNRELRGAATAAQIGVEVLFHGEKYLVTPERQQIVDLLISTFETAVQKNIELMRVQTELNRLNDSLEEKVAKRTAQLTTEINDRRAAEASLLEQKEFLRDVIDVNPNQLFVKDREGRFTLVNKAMADFYGTTTTAIVGKTDNDLNGKKAEVERILLQDKQVIETAKCIHIPEEEYTDQKTGEVSWFQTIKTPLVVAEDGKVQQILGITTNITERKRNEKKLNENEQLLRAIFDASRDGIVIEDGSQIAYINNSYAQLLGYDEPEKLVGKHIAQLLPPDEAERLTEFGRRRLRGEEIPSIYEFKGKHKDGTLIEVEGAVSLSVIGGKRYIMTAVRDLSERKKAENEIRISEQRYRALITAGAQVVWLADADGQANFTTPSWRELTGQTVEETRGWGWLDAFHPESRKQSARLWKAAVENKTIYEDEQTIMTRAGSYRVFATRGVPLFDESGKVREWMGMLTDITDRKQAESALRQSEASLAYAQRITRLGNWEMEIVDLEDAGKNYVRCSDELYRIFGYEPGQTEITGEIFYTFVTPDERTRISAALFAAIEQRTTLDIEFSILFPDGNERILQMRAEVIYDEPENKPLKFIGTMQDITERKEAEKALLESEERLRQSQKMEAIGTLTGGVAHDFNNLLTAILGNTELAERRLSANDPIRLRLTEITAAGKRAAELTGKLLAFSRRQFLERRTVNLNTSVGEIVALLERIIGADVEIAVKYGSELPAVFADSSQIEQVVMNLAVNARDAMPAGGTIVIETGCVELDESYCRRYPYVVPGKYVQIRVSDSGSGMDEKTQARIFEPFFTTKEIGKGTGLGLSMAYGIVKQHDGHINVYSEIGHGTTFKIFLPVDPKPIEETALITLPFFSGGRETILIAEDEENLRNLAKVALEDVGYTVLLAKDGAEAVEIFAANRERIDLFLSDVVMPRMGGAEAYERIRETGGEKIPLIFMTGYSAETVQSRFVKTSGTAERLGAAILQKPYTLEELERIVRQVLDGK